MNMGAWVLREPLKVTQFEDHPYLGTASARLGDREIALHYAPVPVDSPEFRVFLDGKLIFEPGMSSPAAPWFKLCRDLGYDPEGHWDLDASLILFRQVLPVMAESWHELTLPFNELGVPEGVVCLASVQAVWAEGVKGLRERAKGRREAVELVAQCFERLPMRSLTFHDDPRQRQDFVGNNLDEPYLGVFVRLGSSQDARVTLSKATLQATGGMKWSAWKIGGDWREGERDFLSTRGPGALLQAAGLEAAVPAGFQEAFQEALDQLVALIDPLVEDYRAALPLGIPWHRDRRTRYLNHMIVDVRLEEHPVLILDDGSEVRVWEE